MYAAAFIGDQIIDLAGWDQGPAAETSNLNLSYSNQFQSVSYIGGTWGRQFWRPGTMVTVSFDSRFTFQDQFTSQYQRAISYYMMKLPARFENQSGITFRLTVPQTSSMGNRQVETATGVGTIGTSGKVRFTITSKYIDNSPYNVDINVSSGQTASQWIEIGAQTINRVPQVASFFTASSSGSDLILTGRSPYASNDTTLNIAIAQTEGTGVTAKPTSTSTTAGSKFNYWYEMVFYDANVSVAATQVGNSVLLNTSVTGSLAAP